MLNSEPAQAKGPNSTRSEEPALVLQPVTLMLIWSLFLETDPTPERYDILFEVAKGSMPFGPYSTKVILTHNKLYKIARARGPNTSSFLPDCIYHGTWKLSYSSFRAL